MTEPHQRKRRTTDSLEREVTRGFLRKYLCDVEKRPERERVTQIERTQEDGIP
jgi:hypothetical protein